MSFPRLDGGHEKEILTRKSRQEPDDVEVQANVTANPNPTEPYTTVDNGFA